MQLEILYTPSLFPDTLPLILKTAASISRGTMPYSEKALAALLTKLSTFLISTPVTRLCSSTREQPDESGVEQALTT